MHPALRFKLRSIASLLRNLAMTGEGLITGGRGFYTRDDGAFSDFVDHNVDWRMHWRYAKHDFSRIVRPYQPYEGE